jgi:hypothetical protein
LVNKDERIPAAAISIRALAIIARDIARAEAYRTSRCKHKVEMLFAHQRRS